MNIYIQIGVDMNRFEYKYLLTQVQLEHSLTQVVGLINLWFGFIVKICNLLTKQSHFIL